MSVLVCDRKNCDSIMCYRYSSTYGYICRYCFEEMCIVKPIDIQKFMDTPSIPRLKVAIDYEEEFRIF